MGSLLLIQNIWKTKGANIDATATATKFGINPDRAANYNADGEGTRLNYEAVSNVVSELRANRPIAENWKAVIDKDFCRRSKKKKDIAIRI